MINTTFRKIQIGQEFSNEVGPWRKVSETEAIGSVGGTDRVRFDQFDDVEFENPAHNLLLAGTQKFLSSQTDLLEISKLSEDYGVLPESARRALAKEARRLQNLQNRRIEGLELGIRQAQNLLAAMRPKAEKLEIV